MKRSCLHSARIPSSKIVPLALALAAAAGGCGVPEEEATEQVRSAVTGNVSIVGRVGLAGLHATPGITVRLTGSQQQTVVTDSNGAFRFTVPPGSYSVRPSKTGATFTPDVVNLNNVNASVIQDFTCAGACSGTTPVVANKELVITHPTVINDARASNATGGPWSFRFLMEQMAPLGTDPADFAAAWLSQFDTPTSVNGFPVDARITQRVKDLWPTTANGKLDMSKAPFKLISIVNRMDLHAASNGEGRLVYGLFLPDGFGLSMTVIFEYGLPAKDANTGATLTRKSWASKFHALGTKAFGEPYNAALQTVTDLFTRRNTSPLKPGGNSINQVRSNEVFMGNPWQMREFLLNTTGGPLALRISTTGMTPANVAGTSPGSPENVALAAYINTDAALIHGGYASVPSTLLGGTSNEDFSWTSFSVPVNQGARHDFAGQTCNGCHFSEVQHPQTGQFLNVNLFYQIAPINDTSAEGTLRLAPFITDFEIPRRTKYMQNILTCTGSGCSPGASPVFL
jgi:hypothetical protein